jgi:hypothetical protein
VKRRQLSWRPVRNGAVFCAPACGRGCTHAEYVHAISNAAVVAKTLGPGWKPHVWENLGWFYAVEHVTGMKVHCLPAVVDGPAGVFWADITIDGRQ